MTKTRITTWVALATLSATLQAATPFPNDLVPGDLLREIIGEGQFLSTLPDGYPLAGLDLGVPFTLVGAHQTPYSSVVVVRSDRNVHDVTHALAPALINDGWLVLFSSFHTGGGSARLCHPDFGNLDLQLQTYGNAGTQMNASMSTQSRVDCEYSKSMTDTVNKARATLDAEISAFEYEDADVLQRLGLSSSFTAGYLSAESRMLMVENDLDLAELHAALVAQVADAGWQEQSAVAGEKVTTSLWRRFIAIDLLGESSPGEVEFTATLTIVSRGSGQYEVSVSLSGGAPPTPWLSASAAGF